MVRPTPRLALVAVDLAAVTACLSGALYFFHQLGSGVAQTELLANVVLSLPLLAGVVITFALNDLYAQPPGRVPKRPGASPARAASVLGVTTLLLADSFGEVRGVLCGLGMAGCAVLATDHLFGSLQRQATLTPGTIVAAVLAAAVCVPALRAVTRGALRAASSALNVISR